MKKKTIFFVTLATALLIVVPAIAKNEQDANLGKQTVYVCFETWPGQCNVRLTGSGGEYTGVSSSGECGQIVGMCQKASTVTPFKKA